MTINKLQVVQTMTVSFLAFKTIDSKDAVVKVA